MFDSLSGITFGKWIKLLFQNGFRISKDNWKKILLITFTSLRNSVFSFREKKIYQKKIEAIELKEEPIFIIGHWRSGTTFLHTILSQDTRFAYPTLIDIKYPQTIILRDAIFQQMIARARSQKRAMDNITVNLLSPQEEEFAIAVMTLRSSLLNWIFPKNKTYIDKFLDFKNLSSSEIKKWESTYLYYLKKLTYKYEKQLLLKSPSNTGKIRLLLELFPNAKFIHIHRNPFDVFASTKKLYHTAIKRSNLGPCDYLDLDTTIINQYKKLYDAFWEDRSLIPDKNFYEVAFEELETSPMGTVEKIYKSLYIGDFNQAEPVFKAYFAEHSNYKKNKHADISPELQKKIKTAWHKNFEAWNY